MLIVEDELKIRELLRGYFERDGFSVVTTGSGAEAIALARSAGPDLIVLDLRLPDVPGETVAAEVRRAGTTPILMLTAKTGEADRIHGLELGADDYVTKPFSPREVVLRAQAILRRSTGRAATGTAVSFGGDELVIDEDRHEVAVRGQAVDLTATEFGLLAALAGAPGRVYTRGELLNRVRGYEFASERSVDSHVKNLRRKVEADPAAPTIVETVVGVGYRLGLRRD
ncbi:MAG TPA: response regulator transcription factor [Acidimicrobiia bacterium]|nr:response regulator transcription factor [Acidimicrobiia bacterium]